VLQLPSQSSPFTKIINYRQQLGGVRIGRLCHPVSQLRRAATIHRTRLVSPERKMQTPIKFAVDDRDEISIRFCP